MISFVALMFILSSAAPLAGQGRGVGKANGSGKVANTPKGVTSSGAKGQGAGNGAAHAPKAPKTTLAADTKSKGTAATAGNASAAKKPTTSTSTGNTTATTTIVTATTPTTQSVKNPKLDARIQKLLPAGTNVQDAAAGFKNWGQFVAATHVSQNLGISFAELKAQMTGSYLDPTTGLTVSTGLAPKSLGQSIQSVKSGVTVIPTTTGTGTTTPTSTTVIQTEVKKAETQSAEDFRASR